MGACLLAAAIADKNAVAHDQRTAPHARMQDAVLVAQEAHALDGDVDALCTDAGTIAVGAAGAGEGYAADGDVVAGNNENTLTIADAIADNNALKIFPLYDDPVGAPHGAILIGSGSDPDDIPRPGHGSGGGRQAEGASRPHFQHPRFGARNAEQQHKDKQERDGTHE